MYKIDVVQGKNKYAVYVDGDLMAVEHSDYGISASHIEENIILAGFPKEKGLPDFEYHIHIMYKQEDDFPEMFDNVLTEEMVSV